MVLRLTKPCLLVLPLLLAACGGSEPPEPPPEPKVRSIAVTAPAPAIHQGEVVQLSAGVLDDEPNSYDYVWAQTDTSGVDALNRAGVATREFSFTVPDVTDTTELRFSVTASENGVQIVRAEVAMLAYPNPLLSEITITDTQLQACLDSHINDNGWQRVNDATELDCTDANAPVTLQGLEQLTGLTRYTQSSGDAEPKAIDISFLGELPLLREVEVLNTTLADMTWLSDISRPFRSLDTLRLSGNEMEDLSWIGSILPLEVLEIDASLITDLSPLSAQSFVLTLSIGGKEVAEPEPGQSAEAPLQISNFEAVANLLNLTTLKVSHADIGAIDSLENLTALTTLVLQKTDVSDISALMNLTALEYLSLEGSTAIDCADITALQNEIGEQLTIEGRDDCST